MSSWDEKHISRDVPFAGRFNVHFGTVLNEYSTAPSGHLRLVMNSKVVAVGSRNGKSKETHSILAKMSLVIRSLFFPALL